MITTLDRTHALLDDQVVIAQTMEAIEIGGEASGLLSHAEVITAHNETNAAWADVQHTRVLLRVT